MVVIETPVADVVFLIESTANLSPYVENLKINYIIPTLEYFSGGPPDEHDYGFDNNYNCSLYALVAFMTVDCAPEPATICYAPTTSSHKLLQWLDKVQFIGGAGESCSHITEGFSTALQVFDDFETLRESTSSNVLAKRTKHCILICNSPPYSVQTVESQTYFGYMIDQLAAKMAEKQINFSVFSPRKMGFLYKLFEDAGGDISYALTKNYAKDRRHLILLRGFQLQERPMSPHTTNGSEQKQTQRQGSPLPTPQTGTKRPLSPSNITSTTAASVSNVSSITTNVSQPQIISQTQQMAPRGPNPQMSSGVGSQFVQPAKAPTPDSIVKPNRNASPIPISTTWTPGPTVSSIAVSSSSPAPTMPVLTSQLNMRPIRSGTPNMPPNLQQQQQSSIQQTAPTLVNLVSQPPQSQSMALKSQNANTQVRPVMTSQLRAQQPVSSPFTIQAPSPSPSPSMSRAAPSPMQQSVPSPMQQQNSQQLQQLQQIQQLQQQQHQQQQHQQQQQQQSQQQQQQSQQPLQQQLSQSLQQSMNQSLQQPLQQPLQQAIQQTLQQSLQQPLSQPQQSVSAIGQLIGSSQSNPFPQSLPQSLPQSKDQRRKIWAGIIDYQEKPVQPGPINPANRATYTLNCQISCLVVNGEPEINAEKWPEKLVLSLLPKQLIMRLFPILKSASYHVNLHFNNDGDQGLSKLSKIMSTNWVGCIQFTAPCNIRMMIILYVPEKRIYVGFVPHDQEEFFKAMREMIDTHKKEQQAKQQQQKMLQQMSGGTMQQTNSGNMSGMGSSGLANAVNATQLSSSLSAPQQPPQQSNMLLNQALGSLPSNQPQSAFLANNNPLSGLVVQQNNPQMAAPASNLPQQNQSQFGLIPQNVPVNQQMQSQMQQNVGPNPPNFNSLQAERQKNLSMIQQLEQTLKEAQRKELEYQQATQAAAQVVEQTQIQQNQVTLTPPMVRQQLHQQLQQRQLQQQQQQQQQVGGIGNNPQLRHLLQQQQQQQQQQQMRHHLRY